MTILPATTTTTTSNNGSLPISACFHIEPSLRSKLLTAGFRSTADLRLAKPTILSKELGITLDQAVHIVQSASNDPRQPGNINNNNNNNNNSNNTTNKSTNATSVSALEALEKEESLIPVSTSSCAIDSLFSQFQGHPGGIPIGKITEFCGAPGIGKTQLGMQIAMNVQKPKSIGGIQGEALYIDTEGSFIAQRAVEIAQSTLESFNAQLGPNNPSPLTIDSMLSKIHYYRIHDYIEQVAMTNLLPSILESHPNIKVIIIDSIAFHFRQNFSDMALRTRLLNGMAMRFMHVAEKFELAVVLMNQMTTKVRPNGNANNNNIPNNSNANGGIQGAGASLVPELSNLVPALGESWGHAATNRVILYWRDGIRHALLYKSPCHERKTVPYQVVTEGIRDFHNASATTNSLKRPYEEI